MKYRFGIASLIFLNLALLVLFQNCGSSEESQYADSSYVGNALSTPEVNVTLTTPCNGQYNNQQFVYWNVIAICIEKAGANPKYCITNRTTSANTCFNLRGELGWTYNASADRWQKIYNAAGSYFMRATYDISVTDTVDSTSRGVTSFKMN